MIDYLKINELYLDIESVVEEGDWKIDAIKSQMKRHSSKSFVWKNQYVTMLSSGAHEIGNQINHFMSVAPTPSRLLSPNYAVCNIIYLHKPTALPNLYLPILFIPTLRIFIILLHISQVLCQPQP